MRKIKLFLSLLMVMLVSVGNVWATVESVTISPTQALNDGGVDPITIECAKGDGTSNPAISSSQLRLYQASSGKTTGNTITFSSTYSITKIEFTFANNMTASNGSFSDGTYDSENFTWTGSANSLTLTVTGTTSGTRIYITNMVVYYETGGGTPTCATPTFDPASGEIFSESLDVEIAAESGTTIYYTTNGSTPTTSSSVYSSALHLTETTTLKAIATKTGSNNSAVATATYTKMVTVPGYEIDFESDLAAYVDWNFANFTKTNETITVHGGSYFAKTNGTNTASITTKTKVANPGILTYYISKIGTNTNANSKWKARVSSDGTNWTIVGTEYAAGVGVTAGTWNTCTADLSEYSNVFVQVYYDGTSAVRTIDDISLEMASAVAKPTISGDENFVGSTTVTITHADADAIYYTTDGSDPKTSGTKQNYSVPFTVNADGTTTVKAYAVKDTEESGVAEQTFTKATVMTVAQARAAIDAGGDLSSKYVAGIISQIDSYNSTYHSITYWISDDGTTTDQLEVYSGLAGVVKEQFASKDDLAVGDDVTVKGTLKKYSSTYEFDYNNTIVAYKPIARLSWSETSYNADIDDPTSNVYPTLTNTFDVTVAYSSNNTSAATIDPATGEISLVAVGSTTITASFAGNSTYKANSASYTLNVASSVVHATISFDVDGGEEVAPLTDKQAVVLAELPVTTKAGKNFGGWFKDVDKTIPAVAEALAGDITLHAKWLDPYTVAEAKAVIDANPSGIENQYVAGIISQIDSYNNTYHSITYWISADGTTTNQLQVYSGLVGNAATALGKEAFSAKEDLELGDEVVVTGTLKLHNSTTYEFDKNNTIYTFSRKASAGLEYSVTAVNKVVGDADFVNELTNPNSVAVTYETSDDQVAEVANDGTVTIIGEGTVTISASFAGSPTYKAAQVSYTLTVSATVDTRHIANSPATFTTVSGDMAPNDITFASYQGGAGTAPQNYNNGIRLYQAPSASAIGGYITLTAKAGCTIDEVQITTTSTYATTVTYSVDGNETLLKSESVAKSGSYTTGTGLNVQSVNIVNKGTSSSGRLEIASIKVYYTGEPASIHHYVLGGTYQTAFMQGDEFNHTGLIVYAAYDELEETKVDITSMCTFSDPDMNTTGEKTIEITYNEAVVKSYTINVNADSRKVAESPATFTTVSGDMTPNDITFASDQGDASTAPANYNDGIRLYQAPSADAIGGFITLKAKKGCTIDQVKITTTNSYATTVAYSVDGNENLLGSESVAKSGEYTTPSGLNKESVNIVNKGTGSNGRLEIASIKVWYTGDALAVDHYILGGTYETVFEQFGTFSYEGLTVTAAYDELETITEAVTGFTVEADLSTAGAKKAEVMLNSVKIAEYDITVTASAKTDPALAYSPASVILTLGDALSAPTLSNIHNVSPISYESDKPAVATVDAEGNISLAGGCGVAVITASFAENDDYIASEATFTITVNEPAEDLSGTWVVASSIAAGDRIIVGATVGEVTKTMGGQNTNNRAAVTSTLAGGVLTPAEGTKTFLVVDAGDGKFALQALNGKYLTSATSGTGNNLLEAANYENDNAKWTISIDGEGVASVVAAAGSRTYMKYNNGSTLFSCYQYETSQSPINIYKKGTPDYGSYQRTVTSGRYGTICLPKAGKLVSENVVLFEISYKESTDAVIYLDEVDPQAMEAGMPYIFFSNNTQVNVEYTSSVESSAKNKNGLYGTLAHMDDMSGAGIYMISNNQLLHFTSTESWLDENRAYIQMDEISTTEPTSTPGAAPRRRVAMTVNGEQVATGMDALNTSDAPVKVLINGQLYILRGEKMFDAKGQLVK